MTRPNRLSFAQAERALQFEGCPDRRTTEEFHPLLKRSNRVARQWPLGSDTAAAFDPECLVDLWKAQEVSYSHAPLFATGRLTGSAGLRANPFEPFRVGPVPL